MSKCFNIMKWLDNIVFIVNNIMLYLIYEQNILRICNVKKLMLYYLSFEVNISIFKCDLIYNFK